MRDYGTTYSNPVWILWRCDNWRRWSTVRGGVANDQTDGDYCNFSGCQSGQHRIHRIEETQDRAKAHKWFRGYK